MSQYATPLQPDHLTAWVLAGGQSRRMGPQRDKAWLPWNGKPLLLHIAQRLQAQSLVASHLSFNLRHPPAVPIPGPWFSDAWPDQPGPLAGFHTALLHSRTPWALVAPCDAPFLPLNLAQRLAYAAWHHHVPLSVAWGCSASDESLQRQPTFCLLHCSLLPSLEAALAQRQHRLMAWIDQHPHVRVAFAHQPKSPPIFSNVNTPADWESSVQWEAP